MAPTTNAPKRNFSSHQPVSKPRTGIKAISALSVAVSLILSLFLMSTPAAARSVITVTSQCMEDIRIIADIGDTIRFDLPGYCFLENAVYATYPFDFTLVDHGPLSLPTNTTNANLLDAPPYWNASPIDGTERFAVNSLLTNNFRDSRRALQPGDTIGTIVDTDPLGLNYRIIYVGPRTSKPTSPPQFTLNFDANGGTCSRNSSGPVDEGTWITVPTTQECSRSGYELVGFNISKDGSNPLGFDPGGYTVMTGDNTVYAIWRETKPDESAVAPEPAPDNPTITITAQRKQSLTVIRGTSSVAKTAEVVLYCWSGRVSRRTPCGLTSTRADGTFIWAGTQPQRGRIMAKIESTMSNSIRLPQPRQR